MKENQNEKAKELPTTISIGFTYGKIKTLTYTQSENKLSLFKTRKQRTEPGRLSLKIRGFCKSKWINALLRSHSSSTIIKVKKDGMENDLRKKDILPVI